MRYQITAEKPSSKPGEKIILRVDFPAYTEAWLAMRRLTDEDWRITETPTTIEAPTFKVDLSSAA